MYYINTNFAMPDTPAEFITIGAGCTFSPNAFGPVPYTGAVVISPGPGMPLGLSASAACACCRADQKAYLLFKDGKLTESGMVQGRDAVPFAQPQLALQKGDHIYYKVSYLPGATTAGGCCKCLSSQYELNIPKDITAATWCDLHGTLKQRGVTARALTELTREVLALRGENKGYRKRLGIAEPNTPTTPTGELSSIDKIISDVISGNADCGC